MQEPFPTDFQKKTIWKAITGIAILILGALIVGLVLLIGNVFSYLQSVLIPLAIAGIVAYLLDPLVTWLQTKGLSRLKSVITVFLSFLIAILLMAWIIIPPIAGQIGGLLDDREQIGSKVASTLDKWATIPWVKPGVEWALAEHKTEAELEIELQTNNLDESKSAITNPLTTEATPDSGTKANTFKESNLAHYLGTNAEKIAGTITKVINTGTTTILSTIGLAIGLAMVPIYLYYFLKESSSIKANWHKYVPLKASEFKTEVIETLQEINGYLISFFRGQMLVAFIDGMLVGLALWAFGLPYALVIGLAMAVLGVIPFIGNIICLLPACFIAFVHFSLPENRETLSFLGDSSWPFVAATVAIFVIVQQINSLVTAPKIVGDSVGLHPMTVIFSMLFWSLILGGFLGALLAVPLTAAVKVLFRRYVWERQINPTTTPLDQENNTKTLTA